MVQMSARARKHYEEVFLPSYRRYLEEVNQLPLTVLVWGPGSSGDLYQKRLEIRGRLRDVGITAVTSEEIDKDAPAASWTSKARELQQALAADLIVILQASPGSTAEVSDFGGFVEDLGKKMLIFIDERAEHGYSYSGVLTELKGFYGNVRTYKYPTDIRDCHLAGAVLERVGLMRHVKWRRENLR